MGWKLNLAAKFDGCAISRRKRNRSRRRESRELALPYVPDTDRSNGKALVMKAEQPVRQLSGGDTQLVHVPDCDLEQLDTSAFPILTCTICRSTTHYLLECAPTLVGKKRFFLLT